MKETVEPSNARIPAYSRRQAMDWSLVLISQGIEPSIDYVEQDSAWGLVVPADDYEKALEAIRLYRAENRRWIWRREILQSGVVFDWTSLAWVVLLGFFFWLSETFHGIRAAGVMDSSLVANGQVWRLFTAIWLHADLAHLATNAVFGFFLLGLALGGYGTGPGMLAAYLAGFGGNVFAALLSSGPHQSLGASGMVMGSLGLVASQSFAYSRVGLRLNRKILIGLAAGLMMFVLLGLSPGTDVLAHLGGFLGGLVLGSILALGPRLARRTTVNVACGLAFVVLVVWPWWSVFAHVAGSGVP